MVKFSVVSVRPRLRSVGGMSKRSPGAFLCRSLSCLCTMFASVCGARNSRSSLSLGEFRPRHSLMPRCIPSVTNDETRENRYSRFSGTRCRGFLKEEYSTVSCARQRDHSWFDPLRPPKIKKKHPVGVFLFLWWTRRGSNPRTSRMRTVRSPS